MGQNREQLNERAREVGVEDPEKLDTKADVIAAIQGAEQPGEGPGILIQVNEDGTYNTAPFGGIGLFGVPTHLRRAAAEAESALTKIG